MVVSTFVEHSRRTEVVYCICRGGDRRHVVQNVEGCVVLAKVAVATIFKRLGLEEEEECVAEVIDAEDEGTTKALALDPDNHARARVGLGWRRSS